MATDLNRSCDAEGAPHRIHLRPSSIYDTKVYRLALVMNHGELCSALCVYPNPTFVVANLSRLVQASSWRDTALTVLYVPILTLVCCLEIFGEELLFSLFISLTLKDEINKVNIKQLSLFSLYHSVSVVVVQIIQLDVQLCQSLDKLVVVIVGQQIAREWERQVNRVRVCLPALIDRVCACVNCSRAAALIDSRVFSRQIHCYDWDDDGLYILRQVFATPYGGFSAPCIPVIRLQRFTPKSKANCLSPALVNSCLYISSNTLIGNVHIWAPAA